MFDAPLLGVSATLKHWNADNIFKSLLHLPCNPQDLMQCKNKYVIYAHSKQNP